jgi:hypothetical protein
MFATSTSSSTNNCKSKHQEEFVLFPFTNPTPRKNRNDRRYIERKETLTSNKRESHHDQHSDNRIANVGKNYCGNLSYESKTTTSMSGFHTALDIPNASIMTEHRDETGNDESKWVEFGIQNSETDTTPNELSPISMKVQLGQADVYDLSQVGKFIDHDQNDDTETSTTEYDDDLEYGPSPVANGDTGVSTRAQLSTELGYEKTNQNVSSHILMLITNMGMNRTQVQNQQRATMMLNALNISYETIDGSDPESKDIRNELFKLSDMRGMYPQFFIITESNDEEPQTKFLGDFETIEGINDSSSLPTEILDANPTLLTWDRIPYLSYQK